MGERVAQNMTALLASRNFASAEQLAAYLGLVPVEWQSGSSIKGRAHMSKAGPAHLRKLLYMPAIVAAKHNPHIRALYLRLLERGKPKMAAIERPCASLPISALASFILASRIAPLSV